MRIAVMSDVHGFSLALRTVLAGLATLPPVDEVVVAGDLCRVGPASDEVVAALREWTSPTPLTVLIGNADQIVIDRARERESSPDRVVRQLGEDGVAYLASLPFERRITPPGGDSPDDDLLVVHANPHDLNRKLEPEMTDGELREVIGETRAAVIAFGHHHVSYVRPLGEMTLVDVSAVGNPKDGDLSCRYTIVTWDESTKHWGIEQRRLPYPVEETAAQIRASDLPDPEDTLRTLLRASY
ncbi:MAG: metallophosphoesterase [Chloroflexota bacterium]|nr:metallophosphoesterase [Chloroflexota bacterium]